MVTRTRHRNSMVGRRWRLVPQRAETAATMGGSIDRLKRWKERMWIWSEKMERQERIVLKIHTPIATPIAIESADEGLRLGAGVDLSPFDLSKLLECSQWPTPPWVRISATDSVEDREARAEFCSRRPVDLGHCANKPGPSARNRSAAVHSPFKFSLHLLAEAKSATSQSWVGQP
ncbi:hypothetical protein Nepgr_032709 [Nepenthes gracilis]|uniref:Uncharacterized protein n=1 Tax=Nepenthes gracilis TaxID=150966 RepID=A0AAD3TKL4_NEPGR|nr:hypothetical protein Nepgr_032709 [Nepenthes gracilis]